MVRGTLHLDDGETVIIVADDMLSALKLANEKYYGRALKMDFKTIKNGSCEAETGCICSRCGVYIFDQSRHYCPKCGNKRY